MSRSANKPGSTVDAKGRHYSGLYDWGYWFNGETHRLRWGRDFDPDPADFRRQILRAAKRWGYQVETRLDYDSDLPHRSRKRIGKRIIVVSPVSEGPETGRK